MSNETIGATFHLMGRFEVPAEAKLFTNFNGEAAGFKLPDGRKYRVQVTLEEESADGEEHKDLGTCEAEDLGIYGFGELDQYDLRFEDEEG